MGSSIIDISSTVEPGKTHVVWFNTEKILTGPFEGGRWSYSFSISVGSKIIWQKRNLPSTNS